jgi:hypothetical protein
VKRLRKELDEWYQTMSDAPKMKKRAKESVE